MSDYTDKKKAYEHAEHMARRFRSCSFSVLTASSFTATLAKENAT